VNDNVDIAGGIFFEVERLHTNRRTLQGRRGIAEAEEVQNAVLGPLAEKIKPF
jgi:hypothetical protein